MTKKSEYSWIFIGYVIFSIISFVVLFDFFQSNVNYSDQITQRLGNIIGDIIVMLLVLNSIVGTFVGSFLLLQGGYKKEFWSS